MALLSQFTFSCVQYEGTLPALDAALLKAKRAGNTSQVGAEYSLPP